MPRSHDMRSTIPLLLALPLALVACGDDDPGEPDASSDSGTDISDAGTNTTRDAARDAASDGARDAMMDPTEDVAPDAPQQPECSEEDRIAVADDPGLLLGCTADDGSFADCVLACFTDAGIGPECAPCGVSGATCILESCAELCEDATDEECAACVETSCTADFISCVGEPQVIEEPTGPLFFLHAVHLVEGLGPVDLFTSVVSAPFATDIAYGGSTGAVQAVGGAATLDFHLSGEADVLASSQDGSAFRGGESYTASAYGTAESPESISIREDMSVPPGGGARYRYVHVGALLPATLNLWLANEGEPDDTFLEDVEFGSVSLDATRPAGPHRISVDLEQDGTPDVAFDQGTLAAGGQYTYWVTADAGGPFIVRTSAAGELLRFDGETID
jgi:hypothetical protein